MNITLLNGETMDKSLLLSKMQDDSYYYGHLGKHALSSSALKELVKSPKAYKASLNKSESLQAYRDGRLVHMSLLEPHKMKDLVVFEGTKARKEFKEATQELGEHLVYTQSEIESAYWVADAIKSNNETSYLLEDCNYELPGIDMIDDIAHRAKADAISKDGSLIIDIKTTADIGEEGDGFYWSARKFKYALQAALYLRIFGASEFVFVVVDKNTKEVGIFECSREFLELGNAQVEMGIAVYKKYFMQENSDELIKNHVIRRVL